MKLRVNEPQLWLAILLLAAPTLTKATKIKPIVNNTDNTNDLRVSNKSKDTHPLTDRSNKSFIFGNINIRTKNESYLNSVDGSQTNKENDSNINSTSINVDGTGSTTKNIHKINNNKAALNANNAKDRSFDSPLSNDEFRNTEMHHNISTKSNSDQSHGRNFKRKIAVVDGKLESLQNNYKDSNKNVTRKVNTFFNPHNGRAGNIKVEPRDITNAVEFGIKALEELVEVKEPQLYKLGLFLDKDHPAARVATFGAPINQKAILMSRVGYATLEASKKIAESYPENVGRESAGIPIELQSRIDLDSCPLRGQPRCPPASRRFRTSDGTCNNLKHPWRGSAMLPMQRFLPPVYEDGIQSVRRSAFGESLPSARQVSTVVHRDKNQEIQSVTMMFTQWGQFIDHDITSTVKARSFNGSIPRCCDDDGRGMLPPDLLHPSCLPIEVPRNDPFLRRFGIGCMEFIRSAPSTRIDCELGWREQINQVTPYIDASTIYGSDVDTSDSIRTFRKGQIIYGRSQQQGPLNPPDPPEGELCKAGALSEECLQPGDGRVSETPGLIAMHTVFVRYHNKVATVLSQINPHWSDERVYQETRKIVYSAIQHITYREYLPVVLGPEVMDIFELRVLTKGFYGKYDKRIVPAIANSFASAAFRFGHSMVPNSVIRTDSDHIPLPNNVSLHEEISNFNNIWTFGSVDRILLGFFNQPSQRRDEFIAEELTNHLFQFSDATPFGMDLAAINIQRGRDHGIPPYTSWRKPCGLSPIMGWRDLERVMSINSVIRLKTVYQHLDDVDLFTGSLAEKPLRGGVVGPTFACIIAQQFSNLRKGDRFWYENDGFESSFSPAQLQQIRRISLAQIICQTTDEVETIQPFVFLSADKMRNIRVSCDSPDIRNFDLGAWTEKSFESNSISENLDPFEVERFRHETLDLIRRRRVINRLNVQAQIRKRSTTNKSIRNKFKKLDHLLQHYNQRKTNNFPDLTRRRRNTSTKKTDITTERSKDTTTPKSKTKAKIITKKSNRTRTTTLKPFQITSLPIQMKGGNFNNIPKKPTFAKVTATRPTKIKPHYYQIQDTNHDDVTYLLGILPERTTKTPSATPLQVNINIHYSPYSTATIPPVSSTNRKKRPHGTTNPLTSSYISKPVLTGTHRPTDLYGQSDVVIITKRPATSTKHTKRPMTSQNNAVSYHIFTDNLAYEGLNAHELTTTTPTYFYDTDFTPTKVKRPNTNGYDKPSDVFHRPINVKPSTGYYVNNDYGHDGYIPIDSKPSTIYNTDDNPNAYDTDFNKKPLYTSPSDYGSGHHSEGPAVFESKPFSISNKPQSTDSSSYNIHKVTNKRPMSGYYNDNDSDVVIITNNKRRPPANTYNMDETNFDDDILNGFFIRHDGTDKRSTDKNHTKTNVDGKLDFKTRVIYKQTDRSNVDKQEFVEMSSVKDDENVSKEGTKRESVHVINGKFKRKQRRSINRIRIVDVDVMPSESRNRWKYFNATEEPTIYAEVPELSINLPCSHEVPKPMNFSPSTAGVA